MGVLDDNVSTLCKYFFKLTGYKDGPILKADCNNNGYF